MSKTLFRETTEVPVSRSVASICDLLVQSGASSLTMNYGEGQKIVGIQFVQRVGEFEITFRLPARVEPVYKLLHSKRSKGYNFDKNKLMEQAERVAWRQLFAWTEAQLAMIQTGMAQPAEVFMPYAIVPSSGQSLFHVFVENGSRLLTAGGSE